MTRTRLALSVVFILVAATTLNTILVVSHLRDVNRIEAVNSTLARENRKLAGQAFFKARAADQRTQALLAGLQQDEIRLQQEATGSCRRVQILRADVDDAFAALHQAFGASSLYAPRHLAHLFRLYDSHVRYIPPTDCVLATTHPDSYRPPAPQPFTAPQKRAAIRRVR